MLIMMSPLIEREGRRGRGEEGEKGRGGEGERGVERDTGRVSYSGRKEGREARKDREQWGRSLAYRACWDMR